jgi:hypothetical protein
VKKSEKIKITPCNFFSALLEPATEEEKNFSSVDPGFGSSLSKRFDQLRKGNSRSVRFYSEMKSISCGAETKNPNHLGCLRMASRWNSQKHFRPHSQTPEIPTVTQSKSSAIERMF